MHEEWLGKHYHSLDSWIKETFQRKLYKLSLQSGCSCPNRDGRIGYGGCIFCSEGGSGDFASPLFWKDGDPDIFSQIEHAKERVSGKFRISPLDTHPHYIAYFQSFTNTYADTDYLFRIFSAAASHPDIAAISIGTRPDCLDSEKIQMLSQLNQTIPVWIELGLQSIHKQTADFIHRGYDLPVFEEALQALKAEHIHTVAHVILGLPNETKQDMLETVSYLARKRVDGIKLQLLHVMEHTALADLYRKDPFPVFSMEEYIDLVIDCVELLPPETVVHRLTGDAPKKLLIAPLWSGDKKRVLNTLTKRFIERDAWQGDRF